MKTKAQIAIESDARVASISDERGLGDGVWVYLKPGFKNHSTDTGSIHESCWTKCLRVLKQETYEAPDEDETDEDKAAEAKVQLMRRNTLREFVASHGMGDPTEEGYTKGLELVATGDDYATAAAEVVTLGLTEMFDLSPVLRSDDDAEAYERNRRAEDERNMVARYLDANPERIEAFAEIMHADRVAFVIQHAQFAAPYAAPSNPQAFDAPVLVSLPDINEAGLIVGCRNTEDARALAAFMRAAGRAVIVRAWQASAGGSGAYYEVL